MRFNYMFKDNKRSVIGRTDTGLYGTVYFSVMILLMILLFQCTDAVNGTVYFSALIL